jgi:hypothetical protein
MAKGDTRVVRTLTVKASWAMARLDGMVAIGLETQEWGAIAFVVDQRAIDALRRELAVAEQFLRQPTTKN